MNDQYYDTLRIIINSHRLPNETNDALVNRVVNDNQIFILLISSEPSFTNAELLKGLILSPDFIKSL